MERVLRECGAALVWVTHDAAQPSRVGGRVLDLPLGHISPLPNPSPALMAGDEDVLSGDDGDADLLGYGAPGGSSYLGPGGDVVLHLGLGGAMPNNGQARAPQQMGPMSPSSH